jgi:hypothetical protein
VFGVVADHAAAADERVLERGGAEAASDVAARLALLGEAERVTDCAAEQAADDPVGEIHGGDEVQAPSHGCGRRSLGSSAGGP